KGAISQHAAEEKLAKDKQATAQADRVGELQRNLSELQKVASASTPAVTAPASAAGAPAAAATPAVAAPGVAVPVEAPVAVAAAPDASATAPAIPAVPTPAPAATDAPSAEASAAAAQPAVEPVVAAPEAPKPEIKKPVVVPPAPAPEPSFLEELTGDNPLILPAAGGVLAVLLGLLGWRTVQRRRGQKAADATATDSQLPPDSFFGNSGGQQVDTRQSTMAASSTMAYSPSQLDAGGDVDPVAEAEVYLAYGRDVQAEEILKEALRTQPERLGVHMKLAEIYAKRQDAKALEATARAVQPLTQGAGPSWDRIVELGQSVDASNPLYQGAPAPSAPSTSAFADALAKSHGMPAASVPKAAAAAVAGSALSQHLPADLDLSLDMDLPGGLSDAERADAAGPSSVLTPSDQDFAALEPNWNTPAQPAASAVAPAPAAAAPAAHQPLDLSTLEFSLDEPAAPAAAPVAAPAVDLGLNLGDLNLDLGDTSASGTAAPAVADDPLSTKLDLAREFHAIGDSEGARTLVEEVIAEASGDLKERAQRLLSEID
ncbi:MAG: FimV/HubP family polar landmark protein, partial [Comamonas sp.]